MASDWEECLLSKKVEINPKRYINRKLDSVYISMQNLEVNRRHVNSFIRREFKGSGSKFKNGDTLLARITPCLENGKTSFIDCLKDDEIAHGSTEFIVLSGIKDISDNLFVYYMARSPVFRDFAIARMEGSSGRQRVPATTLERFKIKFPQLSEQKAIAHILGTLDDKIELNRQMNETLEAMARAIFKSWFVDFDPVRAKFEGRDTGLPAEIAGLFPDSFEDSGLGPIPKGWRISPLYDIANYVNGAAYRNIDFSADQKGHPVIKIADLKNGISQQTKFTEKELDSKYKIDSGDILFSWSGSPDTSINTFLWTSGPAWLNQHIFKVIPHKLTNRYFIYYLLKYLKPVFIEIARDKQTTGLGHVTTRDLKNLKVCLPEKEIIIKFNETIGPIFEQTYQITLESYTIHNTRDALLPRLISGELRVAEAEMFVRELGL